MNHQSRGLSSYARSKPMRTLFPHYANTTDGQFKGDDASLTNSSTLSDRNLVKIQESMHMFACKSSEPRRITISYLSDSSHTTKTPSPSRTIRSSPKSACLASCHGKSNKSPRFQRTLFLFVLGDYFIYGYEDSCD